MRIGFDGTMIAQIPRSLPSNVGLGRIAIILVRLTAVRSRSQRLPMCPCSSKRPKLPPIIWKGGVRNRHSGIGPYVGGLPQVLRRPVMDFNS